MTASPAEPHVSFILAFHQHQPVGNFDNVFQEALNRCYEPFLDFLESHPSFRVSLHYSGCLFDWLEAHRPNFLTRLARLAYRNQIEMIGGGYYEPILSIIPERDAVGQLLRMNDYLQKRFKKTPRGFWLAERVWEPKLPRLAADADLLYTVTDDTHFSMAGMAEEDIRDFYVTEEEGRLLYVFPIQKELRYLVPFKEPHETLEFLKKKAGGQKTVITFADDGEKFGMWPGTYQWVYKDGWLERFAAALEENKSWLRLKTFSEVIAEERPRGHIYLPTASYEEMLEWSLSLKKGKRFYEVRRNLENSGLWREAEPFLHSGYFKNFMNKYPEVRWMRQRMQYTSRRVEKIQNARKKKEAESALWKGECNCPYWHGVFGGLYLHHLRRSTYENLIEADVISSEVNRNFKSGALHWEQIDINQDGQLECILENPLLKLFIIPHQGGRLSELDVKPLRLNVLDTVTRREEAYHSKIKVGHGESGAGTASIHDLARTVPPQVMERLAFDNYDRGSMLDWIFDPQMSFEDYRKGKLKILAPTVAEVYEFKKLKDGILLEREVMFAQGGQIRLQKRVVLSDRATVITEISLQNISGSSLRFLFGQEWNFTFFEKMENQQRLQTFTVQDNWSRGNVEIRSDKPFNYWQYPIETLAQTEKDYQLMHQGLCIFPHWQIEIPKGGEWRGKVEWIFSDAGRPLSR